MLGRIVMGFLAAALAGHAMATPSSCSTELQALSDRVSAFEAKMYDRYTSFSERYSAYSIFGSEWDSLTARIGTSTCPDRSDYQAAYEAAVDLALYDDRPSTTQRLRQAWSAVAQDAEFRGEQAALHHRLMVSHRSFLDAQRLRKEGNDIAAPRILPRQGGGQGHLRQILTYDAANEGFMTKMVDHRDYTGLVVIAHPGCPFSRAMWQDLQDDPILGPVILEGALWMTGPWADLTPESVASIHKAAPDMPFNVAWRRSDWPQIDYWGSPAIYAYDAGRVLDRHIGWPRDDADDAEKAVLNLAERVHVLNPD